MKKNMKEMMSSIMFTIKILIVIFAVVGVVFTLKTTGILPTSIPMADAKSTSNEIVEKINYLLDKPSKKVIVEAKGGDKYLYSLVGEYEEKEEETLSSKLKFWEKEDKSEEKVTEKVKKGETTEDESESFISKLKFWGKDSTKQNIE